MSDISGIGAGGGGFRPPPNAPLSDEQKALVTETLSNYDPENLSEDDAKAIVSAFREAGIRPGKDLADAASELGFDLREIGKQAGLEPPKGPPPGAEGAKGDGAGHLNTGDLDALKGILEGYDLAALSEEDEESILGALEEAGLIGDQGSLLSLTI